MVKFTRFVLGVLVTFALVGCGNAARKPFVDPMLTFDRKPIEFEQEGKLITLSNGLRAIVLPDSSTNVVEVDVRYSVGAVEDPAGKAGLAHVVEHMVFEARPTGPRAPTIKDRLDSVALFNNAYTTRDETHYISLAPGSKLDALLRLEADRMSLSCEHFNAESFERERSVVINERQQSGGDRYTLLRGLEELWYGDKHPYSRSVIGSKRELQGLTLDDVCRFIEDHYVPANAVVVISGAVLPTTAERALQDMFLKQARVEPTPRVAIPPVSFAGEQATLEAVADGYAAVIAYPAPVGVDGESVYTDLLAFFLQQEVAQKFSDDDNVELVGLGRLGSKRAPVYAAYISGDSQKDVEKAVDAFFEARDEVLPQLFNALLLQRIRAALIARVLSQTENMFGRASFFADHAQYAVRSGFVRERLAQIGSITPAKLATRTPDFFAPDKSHVTLVSPADNSDEFAETEEVLEQREVEFDIQPWQLPARARDARKPARLPARTKPPAVKAFTLDNGLRVKLVSDLSYPIVDIRLSFSVGNRHGPPALPGLPYLAASWLGFDYKRRYLPEDRETIKKVWELGGYVDSDVDDEQTVFSNRGLAVNADGLLWQVFWRVYSGIYDEDEIEKSQDRLRARARRDADADADGAGEELSLHGHVERALFGPEAPQLTRARMLKSRLAVEADELQAFRAAHYRAGDGVLVVTGQFDADEMKARVRRLFSLLPAGSAPPASAPPAPLAKPARVSVDTTRQPTIALGFAMDSDASAAASVVVTEMVEQRLESLRETLGSTYGAQVQLMRCNGTGVLQVVIGIAPERVEQTVKATLSALETLRSGETAIARDFVRARKVVLRRALAELRDSASVAAGLIAPRPSPSAADIAALTVEQVLPILQGQLAPEKMAVVASGSDAQLLGVREMLGLTKKKRTAAAPERGDSPAGRTKKKQE